MESAYVSANLNTSVTDQLYVTHLIRLDNEMCYHVEKSVLYEGFCRTKFNFNANVRGHSWLTLGDQGQPRSASLLSIKTCG